MAQLISQNEKHTIQKLIHIDGKTVRVNKRRGAHLHTASAHIAATTAIP